MSIYATDMKQENLLLCRIPVDIPVGFSIHPNEIINSPESFLKRKYNNIVQYSLMKEGGHFAAFEVPKLLAEDVHKFANKALTAQKAKLKKNEL